MNRLRWVRIFLIESVESSSLGEASCAFNVSIAMPTSLQAFIVLFVVGALLRSQSLLTKTHAERLARFVFSVSLPATILVSVDHVPLAPTAWKLPLAACFITLPMVVGSWCLAHLLKLP